MSVKNPTVCYPYNLYRLIYNLGIRLCMYTSEVGTHYSNID